MTELRYGIADAAYGVNEVMTEFGAKVGDIDVDDVGIAEEIVTPNVLKYLVAGENVRGIGD